MKKLLGLGLAGVALVAATGCSKKYDLTIINWGDYMDESLLADFEKATGKSVFIDYTTSNENMYDKIGSFDLAIPSEYMIAKLAQEDKLAKLDFNLLPNYDADDLDPLVSELMEKSVVSGSTTIADYTIPYTIGTVGFMYKKSFYERLTNDQQNEFDLNPFSVFFNGSISIRRDIYDNSRDAMAAALIHLGKEVNTTNETDLAAAAKLIKDLPTLTRGADNLKTGVASSASNTLEMALVYSGDYFEQVYKAEEKGIAYEDLDFAFTTYEKTNVFLDGMVISKGANVELAHQFINYMLDTDVSVQNIDYVGYCTPFISVMDILAGEDYGYGEYEFYHPSFPGSYNAAAPSYTPEWTSATLQIYTYSKTHEQLLDKHYLNSK